MSDGLQKLAAEAFLYGYPLVYNIEEVDRFTKRGVGGLPAAPFNEFAHATALADPSATFVSINNDTVYSIAQVDVGGGPVRLEVPDTAGRYFVLQFVDAWTNNFAYVGHRATGTAAGSFLLVAPEWTGEVPAGVTLIRLPTSIASIVGRWAVEGESDMPAVRDLQSALLLRRPANGATGIPAPTVGVNQSFGFFERLRTWMRAFPPAAREAAYRERFRPLGLLEPDSPYLDPSNDLAEALTAGLELGKEPMEKALRNAHRSPT